MTDSKGLTKLFTNATETEKPEEVLIEGKVPSFVNGIFLRVGPGGQYNFDSGFSLKHHFDGYSAVSRFEIRAGSKVIYQNKILQSEVLKRANAAGKPVVSEFGTGAQPDPNKGWLARCIPQVIPEMSDNHNMTLYNIGTNVCVAGESCFFRDISKQTLELGDKHDTNKCFGLNFVSPHLLTDETGTTYTVGSSFITGLKYNFVKIPPMTGKPSTKEMLKKSQVIASISSQVSTFLSMHHSFGMTSKYLVFIEQPFVLNVSKILGGVLNKGQCLFDWLEWRSELKNKFYFIDKNTGRVMKTEIVSEDPFMFVHMANCFESDGQMVIDIMKFDNGDFFEHNYIKSLISPYPVRDSAYARAERFVVPLVENINEVEENKELVNLENSTASARRVGKKIIVRGEPLTGKGLELPYMNRRFVGKKYRFLYSTGTISPEGYYENSLVKVDLETKKQEIWQGSSLCYPGEPIFIPNPEANESDEDNGVIISVVSNARNNDYLVFLDAKNFKEIGRATFKIHVPYLIHGLFLPE